MPRARGTSVQEATQSWWRSGPGRGAIALLALVLAAAAVWAVLLALADDEIVLVVPSTAVQGLQEGERVLVRGVVRDSAQAAGADREASDFEGANVIFATSVEPAPPGLEEVQGPGIEEIQEDEDLVGTRVTVLGEVTQDRVGPRAFVIGEPGD